MPLTTLIFHRVPREPDPLFPGETDAADFERKMRWVARWCNVLPVADAIGRLQAGDLPARAVCITFDDGYADNAAVAAPILRRLGLPATFFIATGYVDGGCMWNDVVIEAIRGFAGDRLDLRPLGLGVHDHASPARRRAAIDSLIPRLKYLDQQERDRTVAAVLRCAAVPSPRKPMMSTADVRALRSAGMDVGAHTHTHPILARMSIADAERDIRVGREWLENTVQTKVSLFAYPNGGPGVDYGGEHVNLVRRLGFAAAFSTAAGTASARSDPFQLPRFTPWDRTQGRFLLRLWRNAMRQKVVVA
jgi:peptidoglycan/xylan/chitin deacetylase (PgdA/CDA1 family)